MATVKKIPVTGGPVTTLSSEHALDPGPIRVHSGYLYWFRGSSSSGAEKIKKVSVEGGQVIDLVSDRGHFTDLVVDDTHVYFARGTFIGIIERIPINGGPISTVTTVTNPPAFLAVDEHSVYWIESMDVRVVPKEGGDFTTIDNQVLSDPFFDGSIAVDTTGVYWTETGIGAIMKHELSVCYPKIANPCIQILLLGE